MPYTNQEMAAHPVFQDSITRLRGWGVTVLYGTEVVSLPSADTDPDLDAIPWYLTLRSLPPP
jgi:hypothetical protein